MIGAGVIGLTTALELKSCHPASDVTVVAKHLPTDRAPEYASPWAGANWLSVATDNGPQEAWDAVAFEKFAQLASAVPESGVLRMDLHAFFDNRIEDAGVLSKDTGKIWYGDLVEGFRLLGLEELREGANFGFECSSFVIDVSRYLPWYVCPPRNCGHGILP